MKLLDGATSYPPARFSEDLQYRYTLWRTNGNTLFTNIREYSKDWQPQDFVNFICLNPSTATDDEDDPTIRKCQKFARSWGYDAICVTNLFAYRSTDRSKLRIVNEPIGPENDEQLLRVAERAALVICAWSQDGSLFNRALIVRQRLLRAGVKLHYLKLGAKEPWHPLYLRDDTRPSMWL